MEQFLWGIVSVFHVSSMYNFHVGNIFLLRGRPDSNYHWNEIYYLWNRKPWTWLPKNNSVNLYLANVPILYPLTFMPKLFWVFFSGFIKWERWPKKDEENLVFENSSCEPKCSCSIVLKVSLNLPPLQS